MLFVALKGPAITVNFVNDALRRRPGDHVDGIYERVRSAVRTPSAARSASLSNSTTLSSSRVNIEILPYGRGAAVEPRSPPLLRLAL